MDVDAIIPVFNGNRFVSRAIHSALDQVFPGTLTVWCIDDASTDRSVEILESVAADDSRVRVLRNDRNLGVAATRNRGVRESTGQFIAFLDQDDLWLPGKLERQLAVFSADPATGYVVGQQVIELDEAMALPQWARPTWLGTAQSGYLPSSLMVRRSSFLDVGYFDESFRRGGDDTDWFARARRESVPYAALDVPVVTRYLHDTNSSSDLTTNDELLAVVRRHLAGGEGRT